MVTGQHEDRILKPRLLTHLLKKLPDGHVRITDAFMDDKPFLRILLLILLRDGIRMMTACREHSRHKRLLHLTHLRGIVLQERLVPDGPHPVEVIITAKSFVSIIVLPTVILLETRGSGKSLKTHRSPLCPVEERRLITLSGQQRRNATHLIHRGRGEDERLYKHRDTRQNTRHPVNTLPAVTIAILKRHALPDQFIHARRISFILSPFQRLIQRPDILPSKTLHNQYHYIFFLYVYACITGVNISLMQRAINCLKFLR